MPIDATLPYDDSNIFARILRGEIPAKKVYEDEFAFAFHDIHPQAPVHILVIPKVHYPDARTLAEQAPELCADILREAGLVAAEDKVDQTGYRIVFNTGSGAGQTVWHAHAHVLGGRGFNWPPG